MFSSPHHPLGWGGGGGLDFVSMPGRGLRVPLLRRFSLRRAQALWFQGPGIRRDVSVSRAAEIPPKHLDLEHAVGPRIRDVHGLVLLLRGAAYRLREGEGVGQVVALDGYADFPVAVDNENIVVCAVSQNYVLLRPLRHVALPKPLLRVLEGLRRPSCSPGPRSGCTRRPARPPTPRRTRSSCWRGTRGSSAD